MNILKLTPTLLIAAMAAGLAVPATAETVETGQNEVLGFLGVVSDGGGATLGGGIQHGLASRWLLSGELGYIAGNDSPFRGRGNDSWGVSVDVNAHYLIPLRNYSRFTPYLLIGVGFLNAHGGGGSNTSGGVNLGGGARWAVGRDWGLRPELKFLVGDGTSTRFSLGLYKQF